VKDKWSRADHAHQWKRQTPQASKEEWCWGKTKIGAYNPQRVSYHTQLPPLLLNYVFLT